MVRGSFVLSLLFVAACASVQSQQPKRAQGAEQAARPTPAQMAGIEAFWRDCLPEESIESIRVNGESSPALALPPGSLQASVRESPSGDTVGLHFDPASGTVYAYTRTNWLDKPGYEGRTHRDAVSEAKAWERAVPVLRHYGLSTDRKEYEVVLEDPFTEEKEGDLYGARWWIRKELTHQGLRCRGSQLSLDLSAVSGEVAMLWYLPVVVPRVKHRVRVSEAEAVEKAKKWLRRTDFFESLAFTVGPMDQMGVEQVIGRPEDPCLNRDGKGAYPDTGESFYCWQIPYRYVDNGQGWTHVLWVRVDNGDVIGGF